MDEDRREMRLEQMKGHLSHLSHLSHVNHLTVSGTMGVEERQGVPCTTLPPAQKTNMGAR